MSPEDPTLVTGPIPAATDGPILAFFDVDNTLMHGTSLFQFGRAAWKAGIIGWRDLAPFAWHQRSFIKKGENDAHLASARERALSLIGGHRRSEIRELADAIWETRIMGRLYPGSVQLTQEHMRKGHEVWLVSATPVEIGEVIARRLGLTGALGTRTEAIDDVYTGRLEAPVLHAEQKAIAARELIVTAGADPADCWAYSDSRHDIPLLELVGHPVVVNPDAILALHAARHEWPVLRLTAKSIKEARKRIRREARRTTGTSGDGATTLTSAEGVGTESD